MTRFDMFSLWTSVALADACEIKQVDAGGGMHSVVAGNTEDKPLFVFLHGTGGSAGAYSTLVNSIAGPNCDQPVISLEYDSHAASDAGRVKACQEEYGNNRSRCLGDQHSDAVWGGDSQPKLWAKVPESGSINGRLVSVLKALGWNTYLDADNARYESVVMGGHSQGAGHSAWMAQTIVLRGAMPLSGPQDQQQLDTIDDPEFWINAKSWATPRVVCMNQDPEKDSIGTYESYKRMAGPLGWPNGGKPYHVEENENPPYAALTSNLSTGIWGEHGSTVANPIYAKKVWPGMFALVSRPPLGPAPTGEFYGELLV